MEPLSPLILLRACLPRLSPWSSIGHEASASSPLSSSLVRPFSFQSSLFCAISSSTRVVCSLSRPQVPSVVRRVSLLVRNRLGTVDSLLKFHFPQFLRLLG